MVAQSLAELARELAPSLETGATRSSGNRGSTFADMALCPACFNAPQSCECDPPFDGSDGIEPGKKWIPVRQASVDDIDAVVAGIPGERRHFIRAVLSWLAGEGCWIEDPPARVRDYVNIRVQPSYGPARLASMNRSTGRIEFHDHSFDVARGIGLADRFDHVQSSNAAALTISDDEDRDAATRLAKAFLAARRATG